MNRREFLKQAAVVVGGLGVSRAFAVEANVSPLSVSRKRPNILFCVADDASWPLMGAYGCDWVKTPAFDFVARSGILFHRAYTPNAKCAPSRACILTGRNSWQLEEAANHSCFFPQKFQTYPETLLKNGYHVGHTGKGWAPGHPGEDKDGRQRDLCGPAWKDLTTDPPTKAISRVDYAANFEAFLADKPDDKPFCFWYGGFEPHRAYEWRSGVEKAGKQLAEVDRVFDFWPDNETIRTDLLDYALEVEYFDQHLQRMLDALRDKRLLDNTLLVVTSDHGMPFPRIKGQGYEYSNHIPFAVMWPEGIVNPGRTVDDFVSFIDLAPTFLKLAGVDGQVAGMQPLQGRSLVPIFTSGKYGQVDPSRDHVLIGKERHDVGRPHDWGYPIRGIVQGEYLYLHNFEPERWPAGNPETGYLNCDGSPTKTWILNDRRKDGTSKYWDLSFGKRPPDELYNIASDPDCMHNLAMSEDAAHEEIREKLRERLFAELREQGDPRMFGRGRVFDEYPYSAQRNRNFYDRYMKGEKIETPWVNPSDYESAPLD